MKLVAAKFVPRSRPHSIECATVSHEKWDDNDFTPPLLTGPGTLRFFLFPRMKRDLKGKRFQNVEEVRGKNNRGPEDYHFARVPELFWTVEKAVG